MGVAEGVHVTHAPVHRRLPVNDLDEPGAVEVTRLSGDDFRVSGRLEDEGKIADFHVDTVVHEDVRLAGGQDHARFRLGVMGVLVRLDEGGHRDPLPADLLRQAPYPGKGGDHVEPGECRGGRYQR